MHYRPSHMVEDARIPVTHPRAAEKLDGFAVRRIAGHQECAYQIISLGNVNHCVVVCTDVGWGWVLQWCWGLHGSLRRGGGEAGWPAGWLAGPPRRAKGEENPQICSFSLNLVKIAKFH